MNRFDPPVTNAIVEHVLHRERVAARSEISPQFFHDVEVSLRNDVLGFQAERMILEMHSYVMREKVDVQTSTVSFEKYTTAPGRNVEIGSRRQQLIEALPHATGAVVCGVLTATLGQLIFLVAVACFIAAGVLTWRHNAPHSIYVDGGGVTVRGEVEIDANLWHKFPENKTVYPRDLGHAVKWVELGEPRFSFDPPQDG